MATCGSLWLWTFVWEEERMLFVLEEKMLYALERMLVALERMLLVLERMLFVLKQVKLLCSCTLEAYSW